MTERSDPRAPKQPRAAWTRERLLDALSELLAEQPLEDIRLTDVAARAGMTVGAIYGRFDGKTDMVVAAYERYADDAVKRMESWAEDPRWAEATPREVVASWVEGMFAFTGRREPVVRLGAGTTEPRIAEAEWRVVSCSAEKLTQLLAPVVPEQGDTLARNVGFAVIACRSMMVHRGSIPTTGPLGFDDAQFVEAIIDLMLGMAGLPADTRSERHP